MDQILDKFFIFFHTFLALFSIFGWIWKRIRSVHLFVILLTAFSWFVLGIWHGIGYCPLTEYHWRLRRRLGYQDMPDSYIKFLLDTLTGADWDAVLVDTLTACVFILTFLISIRLNYIDWQKRKISL
jgi:hypothetical protein